MDRITRVWVYLAETPLLWLALTVGVFWLAQQIYHNTRGFALLNPVLVSIGVLVGLLTITDTSYAV